MRDQSSSVLDLAVFNVTIALRDAIGFSTKAGDLVRCRTMIDGGRSRATDRKQAVWTTASEAAKAAANKVGGRGNAVLMQAAAIQIPVFRRYDLIAFAC